MSHIPFWYGTLGIVIVRLLNWVTIVGIYLKTCLRRNKVSNQYESPAEGDIQPCQSNLDEGSEITVQSNPSPISVSQTSLKNGTDIGNDSYFDTLEDALKYQLEEIKKDNLRQFSKMRKTIEKNEMKYRYQYEITERTVERNLKEMNEAITVQHRETKRRLEKLETTKYTRYLY